MRALALATALTLSACGRVEPSEIAECEKYIQNKLRSPSTYKRIAADSTPMKDRKPQEQWVSIEYDAANAYGTPIRDTQICKYPYRNGRADTSSYIDHDAALRGEAGDLEAILGRAEATAEMIAAEARQREHNQAAGAEGNVVARKGD
jgi:hypothetical protein